MSLKAILSLFNFGLLALTLGASPSRAEDEKTHQDLASFADLTARHTSGTVYFLDLDNTTMRPTGFMGSDPWFMELTAQAKERGIEYHSWRKVLNTVVAAVSDGMPIQFADPDFQEFYEKVGPESLIGLTARSKEFQRDLTQRHLAKLGVQFRATGYFPAYENVENMDGTLFAHESGVIIVGRLNKGEVLADFVKRHGKDIKRVVFVDDLAKHAESVAQATKTLDIPVESYRLTSADRYLKDYAAQYRGTWTFEEFLRDYVFGKYRPLVEQYPEELANLQAVMDRSSAHRRGGVDASMVDQCNRLMGHIAAHVKLKAP